MPALFTSWTVTGVVSVAKSGSPKFAPLPLTKIFALPFSDSLAQLQEVDAVGREALVLVLKALGLFLPAGLAATQTARRREHTHGEPVPSYMHRM